MGRARSQIEWQHRLANHLADRGVPATRALGLIESARLWYEVHEPAAGEDVYDGADSWDPFTSDAHVAAAGRMLARLHAAGADFPDRAPQPQAGFVVQIGAVAEEPVAAVERLAAQRPAVSDHLAGRDWQAAVTAAYAEPFGRLRPLLDALPRRPLHGDWQTNNLFFAGDEVAGVIDFHQSDYAPRVLDWPWRSSARRSPTCWRCASSSTGSRSSTTTGAWRATARRPTGPGTRSCSAMRSGGARRRGRRPRPRSGSGRDRVLRRLARRTARPARAAPVRGGLAGVHLPRPGRAATDPRRRPPVRRLQPGAARRRRLGGPGRLGRRARAGGRGPCRRDGAEHDLRDGERGGRRPPRRGTRRGRAARAARLRRRPRPHPHDRPRPADAEAPLPADADRAL